MKDLFKFAIILSLICLVSAGLLVTVNNATEDTILQRRLAEENSALKELFPNAYDFYRVESEGKKAYIALDKNKQPLGYAFKAKARGYSSLIESLAAVDLDDNIIDIKILSQNETPGIGTKISEPQYLENFQGVRLSQSIDVDTISGATTSSSALISSIEKDAQEIKSLVKNKIKQYEK